MVSDDRLNTWRPGPAHLQSSGIAQLMRFLGVERYEQLLALSTADPARYWEAVTRFCGIAWDAAPAGYVDLSAGPEFPRWFPGGRLNWVNTVFASRESGDGAARAAVVAEREDGSVGVLTYGELVVRAREFAAGLTGLGGARGDRIGLLMENGIEATVSLLAIASLGAIAVPLFSGFGVDAIVARLDAAGVGLLIATTGFQRRGRRVNVEATVREALGRIPSLSRVVWKRSPKDTPGVDRDLSWAEVARAGRGLAMSAVALDPDDPFLIIYTSGTTGKPKGVVHTHGGFPIKIAHDAVVHFDVMPGDVYCWPADMGWIAGTLVLSCALLRGATLVCYDGAPDFPDWSRMSRLVERHRVTHFGSAPTLIRGMASNEEAALQGDVSSIRVLITAGEAIDPEAFAWFQRGFGRGTQPLINYTGGTEASGALLSSVVVKPIVPCGFNTISPGIDADVADPSGRSVTDVVGELIVRKPFVGMTRSFWQDDERYLETYWRSIPGLWVHGDLALRKPDGTLYLVGRSDDTIKLAGKRVGPAEVEGAILELAEIAEAAAVGVADPEKGQRLVVFVIKAAHVDLTSDEIAYRVSDHIERDLGRPFRPSAVHVVNQFPKTRSSKVMRRVIRNVYSGVSPGDLSSLDNPAALEEIRGAAAMVNG